MAKSWQCVAWASAACGTCVLIVGACFLLLRLAPGAPEDRNCSPESYSRREIDASEFADDLIRSFRIKCNVKFFDMCAKYPQIITGRVPADYASANNLQNKIVFTAHGLGPAYPADQQGRMTFYLHVSGSQRQILDPHQLMPVKRLDDGQWHEVEMVKGSTSASLIVDGDTVTSSVAAGRSAADFVLRPLGSIHIGGQGLNGDIRNLEIYVGDPERLVFTSACNGTALPENVTCSDQPLDACEGMYSITGGAGSQCRATESCRAIHACDVE